MITAHYTVDGTPVKIFGPRGEFTTVIVNCTGNDVYLGASDVTTSTGLPLQKNVLFSYELSPGDELYAIAATGTSNVSVLYSTP